MAAAAGSTTIGRNSSSPFTNICHAGDEKDRDQPQPSKAAGVSLFCDETKDIPEKEEETKVSDFLFLRLRSWGRVKRNQELFEFFTFCTLKMIFITLLFIISHLLRQVT